MCRRSMGRAITCGACPACSVLLTELPAPRKAAGLKAGGAAVKSADMDAGEPGSDLSLEGPMSMMMLCSDTCVHAATTHCMQMTFLVDAKDQPMKSTPAESTSPLEAAVLLAQGAHGRVRVGVDNRAVILPKTPQQKRQPSSQQRSSSTRTDLLGVKIAGVALAVQLRHKRCLCPGQVVPVQARKPGVLF